MPQGRDQSSGSTRPLPPYRQPPPRPPLRPDSCPRLTPRSPCPGTWTLLIIKAQVDRQYAWSQELTRVTVQPSHFRQGN